MTVNELVEGAPVGILVTSQVLGVHYVWKQVQGAELVVPIKEGTMLVTLLGARRHWCGRYFGASWHCFASPAVRLCVGGTEDMGSLMMNR